ncbi:monocarboxylate transporter 9-like [Pecten maximus]|uniref:monocarboxylate transporter 9-like n=1 Tax=Pecten maximus TaxID=6579 RepID=UPI001458856E|nr:monocarboxylate transporter 9-like [Pecten maximus]
MSANQGTFLISLIGISNTVTRVLVGYVTDKPWANTLIIINSAQLIGGVFTCFVPFYTSFVALAIYAVLFGAVIAVFACLRSILIAELFGVHKLSSSYGILGLSMGLSTFVGSPIAGALSDMSGNYSQAFYFSGVSLVLGGLICLPLRRISEWENNRRIDINLSDKYGDDPEEDTKTEDLLSTKRRSSVNTIQED